MKASVGFPGHDPEPLPALNGNGEARELVLEELERILASRFFRSASRSKQFLNYVVQHQLGGHPEVLKERTIGTEVFLRDPNYKTGDDPVVRVQAGEVRRRLDQYYQDVPHGSKVRIELPVGSYSPVFRWNPAESPLPSPVPVPPPISEPAAARKTARPWKAAIAVCAVLAIAAVSALIWRHRTIVEESAFNQFWNPVLTTQQPVLICLAKGVTYRPGPALYDRFARSHPGAFQTEVERFARPLPLDPNEKLTWGDMQLLDGYGVALGDVSSAIKFSGLLGKMGKANQVRIGDNYSYADLRNSPAIVVGAFNNRWTMEMLSNLHFTFVIDEGKYTIREQLQGGRFWVTQFSSTGKVDEDYAILARLLDSKTGQFTVIVAGLTDSGTQAAGELASNPEYLEAALRNAPAGWQKKNLEIVLKTPVTDSIPGPPQFVAAY